jgi:asparaginyl-tRNA synthetase
MMSATVSPTSKGIIPRIKTSEATKPSDGPVIVKGWVRTVRKQKTLAFVEVNDGSNLGGIQCVASFDDIDEATKQGKSLPLQFET